MSDVYTVTCPRNDNVFIHLMAGHFISSSNHINYYIGTSDVKHNHAVSVDTAMLLSEYYNTNDISVDTVLCLYETQALGAYLAHELARPNMLSPNPSQSVYTVGSEYDAAGNLIFRDNLRRMINGKNVVVLISCITSGRTVERELRACNITAAMLSEFQAFSVQKKKFRACRSTQFFQQTMFRDMPHIRLTTVRFAARARLLTQFQTATDILNYKTLDKYT